MTIHTATLITTKYQIIPNKIRELTDKWLASLHRNDAVGCAELYTEDGVINTSAWPCSYIARPEIIRIHQSWIDAGEFNQSIILDDGFIEGDLGFSRGNWAGDFPDDNGKYKRIYGKFVSVIRHIGKGEWRFYITSLTTSEIPNI